MTTVQRTASGGFSIRADGNDTYAWANRPGARWPASDLSGHAVTIEAEPNGDLVDYTGPDDVSGNELRAFQDDAIADHRTALDERVLEAARKLGAEHGKAAASWVFDGNTEPATYGRVLRGIREGDPEILDMLADRGPDLSGQWADEPTGPSITRDVLDDAEVQHSAPGDNHAPGTCDYCDWLDGMGTLLDEYEQAYRDAVEHEVERVALDMHEHEPAPRTVPPLGAPLPTCDLCGVAYMD